MKQITLAHAIAFAILIIFALYIGLLNKINRIEKRVSEIEIEVGL